MGWDLAFAATATYAKPEQFETFRRHIEAAWIEQALAACDRGGSTISDQSLTVVDRGFVAGAMLLGIELEGQNRHWLTRAKSNSTWRLLKRLGEDDELVEMDVSSEARRKDPSLPRTWTMRAIRYQRRTARFVKSAFCREMTRQSWCSAPTV